MGIKTDWGISDRYAITTAKGAIGKNLIIGLIEIMTNADDSYHRLESNGLKADGRIVVYYKPGRKNLSEVLVTDYAEGMTRAKIERIMELGGRTSGREYHKVRGVLGRGLKECIISLCHLAYIYSICDDDGRGMLTVYKLYPDELKKELMLHEQTGNKLLRKYLMDSGQRTMIRLILKEDVKCPSMDKTLKSALQNNFFLRKIMTNPNRKVTVRQSNRKQDYVLRRGDILGTVWKVERSRKIPNFEEYTYDICVKLSEVPLSQKGPERDGGILITSGNSVHDCTLFGYEEEATRTVFGELNCPALDEMLLKDIMVVKPDRSGLNEKEDFVKSLIEDARELLRPLVGRLQAEYRKNRTKLVSEKEIEEFRNAVKEINEISRSLTLGELTGPGEDSSTGKRAKEEPPVGVIEFTTPFIPRPENIEFNVYAKVRCPEDVHSYELIEFSSSNPNIVLKKERLQVGDGKIIEREKSGEISSYIKIGNGVIGTRSPEMGTVSARVRDKSGIYHNAQTVVSILPPLNVPKNGIEFARDSYEVRLGQKEYVELNVDSALIAEKEVISLHLEGDPGEICDFELSHESIAVMRSEERVITKRIGIEGKRLGSKCTVVAVLGALEARTEVTTVSVKKEDEGDEGFIKDIRFNDDEADQRRGFENGIITIFLKAPIVAKYEKLGRDSTEFQILKSELILQTWSEEFAKHRVKKGYSKYSIGRSEEEAIELETHQLEKDYSHKIHEMFIGKIDAPPN